MPLSAVDAPFDRADLDLGGLLEVEAGALDDEGVAEHLVALHRLRVFVDAAVTATAGVFDARSVWARDGARNAPGWITARTNASYGAGKADVALARELRHMPVVAEAFAAGRLGREQVRLLAKARADGLEEMFATCEEVLVDEVVGCTVAGAARLLRRWAATVRERLGLADPDRPPPNETDHGSRVHLSSGFEGRWALDGSLDPEMGEVLANAIDHQVDAMWRDGVFQVDDGLVPAERRAVALAEVVCRSARGGDDDGTARPLVLGLVDLTDHECHCHHGARCDQPDEDRDAGQSAAGDDAGSDDEGEGEGGDSHGVGGDEVELDGLRRCREPSRGEQGPPLTSTLAGLAELSRAGVVSPRAAERWLCEGTVQPVYVGPGADQLQMGRKVRVANRAQRRALRVRDGGCVFPGCSVAAEHCVAHHVVWWEVGGRTDLANLVLVCRFHHKAVHDRGFRMTRTNGHVHVTRPDGSPIRGPLRAHPGALERRVPTPATREPVDHPGPAEAAAARALRRRVDEPHPVGAGP